MQTKMYSGNEDNRVIFNLPQEPATLRMINMLGENFDNWPQPEQGAIYGRLFFNGKEIPVALLPTASGGWIFLACNTHEPEELDKKHVLNMISFSRNEFLGMRAICRI